MAARAPSGGKGSPMSRLLVTVGLLASLSFSAFAAPSDVRFAQPPGNDIARISNDERPVNDIARARVHHIDRKAVRAKLIANRTANLARFRAYQRKGVFPSNTYTADKL